MGDVRKLPADVAAILTDQLADAAERVVANAHNGVFGMGSDVGSSLVLLNAWHPNSSKWEPLLRLLDDDRVLIGAKRYSLRYLASLADHVPQQIRERLIPIATKIARRETAETHDFFGDGGDAAGEATNVTLAFGGIDAEEFADRLVDLLAGGPTDRRWAARVAAQTDGSERVGLLVTLAADADASVRAAAAHGLASAVVAGEAGSLAERALQACVTDPGSLVPAHAAAALREAGGELAETLLAPLQAHPSAYVREAATGGDG
jgi:HEAT repeat protein